MSYSPTSSSSSETPGSAVEGASVGSESTERDRERLGRLVDCFGKVQLELECRLGQTEMKLRNLLGLSAGSIVVLDRVAGEDLDVSINGRLFGRAEVLVVEGRMLLRMVELGAHD